MIVDDGGARFLKTSSAYPDPDPGFHPDPGSLWYPGAGTLPALSALRELLPRAGWSAGRSCRWRSSACSPWRCWLALRRTGPGAGSPEFPVAGILAAAELGLDLERTLLVPDLGGRLAVGGGVAARRCEIVLVRPPGPAPGSGPAALGGGAPARAERAAHRGRLAGRAGAPTRHRAAVGRTRRRVRAAAGVPRGGDGGRPRGGQVLRRNCAVCGRPAPGRTGRV